MRLGWNFRYWCQTMRSRWFQIMPSLVKIAYKFDVEKIKRFNQKKWNFCQLGAYRTFLVIGLIKHINFLLLSRWRTKYTRVYNKVSQSMHETIIFFDDFIVFSCYLFKHIFFLLLVIHSAHIYLKLSKLIVFLKILNHYVIK